MRRLELVFARMGTAERAANFPDQKVGNFTVAGNRLTGP